MSKRGSAEGGRLWREAVIAGRFGIIGAVSTVAHMMSVSLLIYEMLLPVLVANAFSFLMAFGVSFFGNYFWTYKSPGNPGRAALKFLAVSVGAFVINSAMLVALLNAEWVSPLSSALLSAAAIPLITFLASRAWVFRR